MLLQNLMLWNHICLANGVTIIERNLSVAEIYLHANYPFVS